MNPPFLVIRPGQAFWVERGAPQNARATLGAFAEGCYAGTRWYDATGGVWSVVEATLRKAPSLLDRALQRPVPVVLRFGPRGDGDVADALTHLHEVLRSDNDFCDGLRSSAAEVWAQCGRARTIAELVDVASRLE
jgi:hypothetical protein